MTSLKTSTLSKLFCPLFASIPSTAWSEGFNSENFTPSANGASGILWEHPSVLPQKSFSLASTLSYANRPIEFGDGEKERLALADSLLVNHLGFAYGIHKWIQIGANLPIAIFANPNSAEGYLRNAQARDRDYFFPGDLTVHAKFAVPSLVKNLKSAVAASFNFPTGSREALLTDDSIKLKIEIPISLALASDTIETFFTPGYSMWESPDRIYAYPTNTSPANKLLRKSQSLLLAAGVRYWLTGNALTPKTKSLVLDAGIRGDFSDSKVTFVAPESPVEWSIGAGYFFSQRTTLHVAYGSGLGVGAGAPLSRIVAGVRFSTLPPVSENEDSPPTNMLSSSAYSDQELETILEQARAEPIPPSLGDDENIVLRLKVNGVIIDIGAINFESNSAELSAQTRSTIALLQQELQRINPNSIKIEGHTDSVGSYNYNLALSKQRADAVKKELARLGQDQDIMESEGFSYKFPVASNATAEGRKQNRRIEVSVDGESFRKQHYSPEEETMMQEWIAPSGKKPKAK